MKSVQVSNFKTTSRYKKSMILDQFILFLTIITLYFLTGVMVELYNLPKSTLIVIPIVLISFAHYMLQDFIFKRSIGKKIYKLKIVSKTQSKRKLLKALFIRRLLEATYQPLLNKDFDAISNMIEAVTETKIVDDD